MGARATALRVFSLNIGSGLEEHPKLLASTRYSSLEHQYKALNDIMNTLNNVEVFQSMVREGLKIVFVVEHGVPVDDGCVRSPEGISEISGLTRSKAVFRAGEYQHPLTYFPTWQEVTNYELSNSISHT